MFNNPFLQIIQTFRSGGNMMNVVQSLAQNNPAIAQVMQMTNGKSHEELKTMAENMCKERGVSLEQVAGSLGFGKQ